MTDTEQNPGSDEACAGEASHHEFAYDATLHTMNTRFENRTAVVTGATSAIGEAIAARLVEHGARVVGIGRSQARLDELRRRWGEPFVPVRIDLSQADDRRVGFGLVRSQVPVADILISNAAECTYEAPTRLSIEDWRLLIETNLLAAIDFVQAMLPVLAPHGHIVQVSSTTARWVPNARFASYALTKASVDRLAEALRLELAPKAIHVTQITPGLVETPIYDKLEGFDAMRSKLREQISEWLKPDDVADAILFALSRPAHVTIGDIVILPRGQAR